MAMELEAWEAAFNSQGELMLTILGVTLEVLTVTNFSQLKLFDSIYHIEEFLCKSLKFLHCLVWFTENDIIYCVWVIVCQVAHKQHLVFLTGLI